MMESTGIYWISLSYATFGLVVRGGIVTDSAPIARWTRGKDLANVLGYYRGKGALVRRVGNDMVGEDGLQPTERT